MADRLIVVACRESNAANKAALLAVPIQGGWGPGVLWGLARVWGFWPSTALPTTRAELIALRDAGEIKLARWDVETLAETHEQFLTRCRTEAATA